MGGQILVPTDFTAHSLNAMPYALELARLRSSQVLLAHFARLADLPEAVETGRMTIRKHLSDSPLDIVVEADEPGPGIIRVAEQEGCDLIVMASAATPLSRMLMGSTAEWVMRHAACPVMVVRHPLSRYAVEENTIGRGVELRRILVPIDFSPVSVAAVPYAVELARQAGARLELVHALGESALLNRGCDDLTDHAELLELRRQLREIGTCCEGIEWTEKVVAGPAAHAISRIASQDSVDLIVMTTHGRSGLARLALGSTAETVLRRAPCPVLTLRVPTVSDRVFELLGAAEASAAPWVGIMAMLAAVPPVLE
ncbi:MAG: universal stress protein [Armatimonadetes bacterium]|nr:universal stress protein [Armatimonadota bacterium]